MSKSHRDHDNSSNTSLSHNYRNNKDEIDRYNRKRSHFEIENIDHKVYVGNVSTEKVTDDELLHFFKPYGKVSDIRVFKDYILVQYNRVDDAKKLLKDAQTPLILKGNKLEILPARDVRSRSRLSSSADRSSKNYERHSYRQSSNYEPARKKFPTYGRSTMNSRNDPSGMKNNDSIHHSSTRSDTRRTSNDSISRNPQILYTTLTGPKNTNELVDCQIIIVNARQKNYGEDIESRLHSYGIVTSIILLREDYTLIEAVENAARLQCLYGIIAMPMHEERRTASFHILYGQTEEHRNLTLEDGLHIITTNFLSYKERFQNKAMYLKNENNDSIVYSDAAASDEYFHLSNNRAQEEINPPILTLGDKLPLSMLLCLLADGRQLTLEEIDRVLIYLLEKKAKMLTLPQGTLPPLPALYATTATTAFNHHTGSGIVPDARTMTTSDMLSGKSSSSSAEVSSSIAEQIRQILSTNLGVSNSSTGETTSQSKITKPSLDKLPDIVKVENTNTSLSKSNMTETGKDFAQQQPTTQHTFTYPKAEAMSVMPLQFNYTSSTASTTGSVNSFVAPNFPSYSSTNPSVTHNSGLKSTTSVKGPNAVSQTSQYFYPIPPQTAFPSPFNSTVPDAATAIFQAYSQFNIQPTPTPSIVTQQINAQQQQQIRK